MIQENELEHGLFLFLAENAFVIIEMTHIFERRKNMNVALLLRTVIIITVGIFAVVGVGFTLTMYAITGVHLVNKMKQVLKRLVVHTK